MIDAEEFWRVWTRLCRRFGRKEEREEAMEYLAYLERMGIETAQVLREAEGLWATREFFPRPADFLRAEAALGWRELYEFSKRARYGSVEAWHAGRARIPDRAWEALESLGGLDMISSSLNLLKVRAEYFHAFELLLIEEAAGPVQIGVPLAQVLAALPEEPGEVQVDIRQLYETAVRGQPERLRVKVSQTRIEP